MIYIILFSFPLLIYVFKIYLIILTSKFYLIINLLYLYDSRFWRYLIIYGAFFVKIPIYIFHVWLPKAHVEAPVYGSIILAAILLKIGGYGLIRLFIILFKLREKFNYIIFRVSIYGGVFISIVCLVQVDLKRLVAYSSVVHINMLICSMITLFKCGILRGYIIIISHGLCSSGLFYIVNLYYRRRGRRLLILNKGIIRILPLISLW